MPVCRDRVAVRTMLHLVGDLVQLVTGAVRSRAQLAAENLFLRKQAPPVYGAPGEAISRRRCDPDYARRPIVDNRLASSSHGREAGDADPVASQTLSAVLAMEIPSADSRRSSPRIPARITSCVSVVGERRDY